MAFSLHNHSKCKHFFGTHILREIKFEYFRSSKIAVWTKFEALKIDFDESMVTSECCDLQKLNSRLS